MNQAKAKEHPLEEIHSIPLKVITISADNVRLSDPTKDLDELAASIKKHGLLQPVILKGKYGHPPYELISGQRRFLAHQKILKWPEIRAVFVGNLSRTNSVVRSLVENMQRLELEYVDTAKAVTYLYETYGKNDRKVHEETGLSLRKVRDFILIEARATPKMKGFLRAGKVSPVDVKRAIRAAQDDLKKAEALVELIIKHKPTVHQKKRLVMYGEREKRASAEKILDEAMKAHVEQNIIISLPDEVREGLIKATKSMAMEADELATKVLIDWLRDQGFVA
ncbi:MAG: ParB/RepB/Spo0J family partition protein [Burkholderiales bacterium]|jgi:ParB family chromosome partitioning protein